MSVLTLISKSQRIALTITIGLLLFNAQIEAQIISAEKSAALTRLRTRILPMGRVCQTGAIYSTTKLDSSVTSAAQGAEQLKNVHIQNGATQLKARRMNCNKISFQGDFDAALFNGLLCSTGKHSWACKAVQDSQTRNESEVDYGRFWRSPRLRENKNNQGLNIGTLSAWDKFLMSIGLKKKQSFKTTRPSFSKDMGKGVLMYLIQTRDVQAGNHWSRYIQKTKSLCPDDEGGACKITPMFWLSFNFVASRVGFEPLPTNLTSLNLSGEHEDAVYKLNARMSASTDKLSGYQYHLIATHLYIRKKMDYWSPDLQEAAEILHQKFPLNPFYHYLARGPSDETADRVLNLGRTVKALHPTQWMWEKNDHDMVQMALTSQAMGWDIVFMIDLMPREALSRKTGY